VRNRSFRQGATTWLDDLIFKFRAQKVLASLPARAGLLADLGSGYDARFLRLARRTGRIEAGIVVDVSLDPSRPDPAITLIEADLSERLPIPDSSVPATTSLAVLEHLERPALHVSEMHRILRPGGVAIMTTPSVRSKRLLELLAFRLHVIDADEIRDHKHYYTKQELHTLLVRAGFAEDAITYRSFALGMNQLVVAAKEGAVGDDSEGREAS
jgi:SAM-dependent methyltransferase